MKLYLGLKSCHTGYNKKVSISNFLELLRMLRPLRTLSLKKNVKQWHEKIFLPLEMIKLNAIKQIFRLTVLLDRNTLKLVEQKIILPLLAQNKFIDLSSMKD